MAYSTVLDHREMIFDGIRNAAYYRALKKAVQPDSIVMDVGAGLGIHGLNAASLGAAEVHLVDPSPVLEIAKQVAGANKLENIHYHNCRVEELDMSSSVDILVSVFTGNFLLTEDLLGSLFYSRDKFLKPGGKMFPDMARMEVMPVCAPAFYEERIDSWGCYPAHAAEHGEPELSFTKARSYACNSVYYDSADNFAASPLANPNTLMELDLLTADNAECDAKIRVETTAAGVCHGWLGWFQMRLGDEWLSTAGHEVKTHWRPAFLPLESPVRVSAGEEMFLSLKRPQNGEWTWITEHRQNIQRQSTFLSMALTPDRIARSSESFKPVPGVRSQAAEWLLREINGDVAVCDLSNRLQQVFPEAFTSDSEAVKFTKDLVARYT